VTGLVAVLAGGRGRRLGAPKPLAELAAARDEIVGA
jgi:molybdopterin-guanine dinucleotide biosynthesis protein A